MKLTTNYSLKKPEGSDVVNIDDFNYNADAIDSAIKTVEEVVSANKTSILELSNNAILYSDKNYSTLNSVPLKPGRYGIGFGDDSFPTTYGNLTIDYGSYTGEYIATFRGMNGGVWISYNRYSDISDRGWKPWQKITTTSTFSLLEEQVSALETQNTENEKKISILECENKALKEELTQIQTSIASLTSLIATTLEEK